MRARFAGRACLVSLLVLTASAFLALFQAASAQPYLSAAVGGKKVRARPKPTLTAEQKVTAAVEAAWSGLFIDFNGPLVDPRQGRQVEKSISESMLALLEYRSTKTDAKGRYLPNWVNGVTTGRILTDRQLDMVNKEHDEDPRKLFLFFDVNGDEQVSFEEFHRVLLMSDHTHTEEKSKVEFKWADGDGDGAISLLEFEVGGAAERKAGMVRATRTIKVPVVQFLVAMYLTSRSHYVREALLTFLDEVVDPNPPPFIQNTVVELGLLPDIFSVLMSVPLDITLITHLHRAGLRADPFVLTKRAWVRPGPRLANIQATMLEDGFFSPVGMSHMHLIAGSGDVEVGLAKILFTVTDVMRAKNVNLLEALELVAKTSMNSDQGHMTFVLFPNLALGETFTRVKNHWNAGSANDFVMRGGIQQMCEDAMMTILQELASDNSTQTSSVLVDFDTSSISADQLNRFGKPWYLGYNIPAKHPSIPAHQVDMRELILQSFNAGRNPLHIMAISGRYSRVLEWLLDEALRQIEREGLEPVAPLDGDKFLHEIEQIETLSAKQQFAFKVSQSRFNARSALEVALRAKEWRLGRNPFHFAGLLHSNRSRTYHALCHTLDRLGLDPAKYLDVEDYLGFTARQYAGDGVFRNSHFELSNWAPRFDAVLRQADVRTSAQGKSSLIQSRPQGAPVWTDLSAEELDARWMRAGEHGGWDFGKKRPDLKLPSNLCDIREFYGTPTPAELAVAANSHVPVIWRGGAKGIGLDRAKWSYDNLLEKYGDVQVSIADIPYRSSFASVFDKSPERKVTLREYVETFKDPEEIPLYLFSSDFADDHPTIYEECRELIEIMDEVPGIQALKQGQFFLGPAGTGAPVHWHSSAVNALLYGKKRWVVAPAKDALYSVKPALQFFQEDLEILRMKNATTDAHFLRDRSNKYLVDEKVGEWEVYEFTQEAGDLVMVPDFWGHGTVNVEASIGIAFEFQNQNDKLFGFPATVWRDIQINVPGVFKPLD